MNLSPHFTLQEFLASDTATAQGIDNTPDDQSCQNLSRVAQVMEQVRILLGSCPITITSGYRCPALNAAINGAENSAHLSGLAADFVCAGYTVTGVYDLLIPYIPVFGIDQLIWEYGNWVHLGLSPYDPRLQYFEMV